MSVNKVEYPVHTRKCCADNSNAELLSQRGVNLPCQLLFNACHHGLEYVYFSQLLEDVLLIVLRGK